MQAKRESKVTGWMRLPRNPFIRVIAVLTVITYFALRRQRRLSGVTHPVGQSFSPGFAVYPDQELTQPTIPTSEAGNSQDEFTMYLESGSATWNTKGLSDEHQAALNVQAQPSPKTEDRHGESADALASLPKFEGPIDEKLELANVVLTGHLEIESVTIASTEADFPDSQGPTLHDKSEGEGPTDAGIEMLTTAGVPEAPDMPLSAHATEESTTIRAIPEWLLPDYDDDPSMDVESAEGASTLIEGSEPIGQTENSEPPTAPEACVELTGVYGQPSPETSEDHETTGSAVGEPISEPSDVTAAEYSANDQDLAAPTAQESANTGGSSLQTPRRAFRQRMKRWLGRRYSTSDKDLIRRRLEVNNGLDITSQAQQDDNPEGASVSENDEKSAQKTDSAKLDSDAIHIAQPSPEPTYIRLQRRRKVNRVEA